MGFSTDTSVSSFTELDGPQAAARRLHRLRTAKFFLEQQLVAVNNHAFPRLEVIRFEGFYIFLDATPEEAARTGMASVFQLTRECPFANSSFVERRNL